MGGNRRTSWDGWDQPLRTKIVFTTIFHLGITILGQDKMQKRPNVVWPAWGFRMTEGVIRNKLRNVYP